jgi:beta-phosphoglucomutase-like phosphatase (HAD superfamily)
MQQSLDLLIRIYTQKKGALEVVTLCKSLGLPIAIASSSSLTIIDAVVTKLGIKNDFKIIHSAEAEALGKPDPAVYLKTAKLLELAPANCLVFEDSISGVRSAKAAGMCCIAVPEEERRADKQYVIADLIVDSLLDITITTIKDM